ncbi:M15 family peptidase [Pseudonocardiaceae bacterium YIM PH 21723]|nr:M15 family peptidase [Pseudonocardiaceae bacterium YIM PH 21723]
MGLLDGIEPAWGNYDPPSLGWDSNDIVPYSYDGVEFPDGVQEISVPLWNALLGQLVPLLPGGLKAGTCWGFKATSTTTGGTLGFHAYGVALDINAPDNEMRPDGSDGPHTVPEAAEGIARSLGMEWGGGWTSPKDYMHFEIHLTPAQVETVAARLAEGETQAPPVSTEQLTEALRPLIPEIAAEVRRQSEQK